MLASNRLQLICALTLALLCCNVNAQTVNLNNICLLLPNNQLITDTNSCDGYYLCSNGVAVQQTCQNNFYFSKDQQGCVPASQVNCGNSNANPCTGYSTGTWAPAPGSCSGYYYCAASGPQRSNCADGQNFNPTAQMCQYASQYPCGETGGSDPGNGGTAVTQINLCTYIKNGLYFGSAGSCGAWNICKNNLVTPGNCDTPLVFNVALGTCSYRDQTNCQQVTHDPQLTGVSPTYGGPCTEYGLRKAATACNQYYFCNGGSYNLEQCTGGQFYDTTSQTCMNRLNAFNECDRCAGTKKSFVNKASPTSCVGYLYCVDGIQQSEGNCNPGSFFNEIAGVCEIGVEPKFGCCNPNWNNPNGPPTGAPGGSTLEPGGSTLEPGGSTLEPGGSTLEPGGSTLEPGGSTTTDVTTTEEPTTTADPLGK